PVHKLMLAVLEQALRDCGARHACRKSFTVEARQWLLDADADGPFASATICEVLGIDADRMRQRVRSGEPLYLPRRRSVVPARSVNSRSLRGHRTESEVV